MGDLQHRRMLPDQFHWHDDQSRLKLRDHTLILIDAAARPVALVNIMRSCMPRRLFFASRAHAVRYAECWAAKWERDIRLHVGNSEWTAEPESAGAATPRRPGSEEG